VGLCLSERRITEGPVLIIKLFIKHKETSEIHYSMGYIEEAEHKKIYN